MEFPVGLHSIKTPRFAFSSSSSVDKTTENRGKRPQRACVEANMEILDSTEQFLHWDRNLSELSEDGEIESVLYTNVSDRSGMEGWLTGSGN